MNIKITHNWLLEYLETNATPQEIQKYLSLCGPSVESVSKVADPTPLPFSLKLQRSRKLQGASDYVYDIETTSNRVDMASVFGIAQEASAILPQFGKKAKLKTNPLEKYKFNLLKKSSDRNKNLEIKIKSDNLCSRFTAVILENVKISVSPDFVAKRLQLCGIKSINNVVDISNYLMLALGQPVHIFDYDLIGKSAMIMRESKKGEKIETLDGKQIFLPGRDIVIEDGEGKLIDLCGIMGGLNSAVNSKTNKIILFVQTYNPQKIRRTSMTTGQRTVAATYFEKGLDEERVEPTTIYGIELLEKYTGAKIASQLYDIYPNPYQAKSLTIFISDIQRVIGVPIVQNRIIKILSSLGFRYLFDHGRAGYVTFEVPSYRNRDMSIKEDLIEEVARIYGYHNLPNNIQPTVYVKQPKDMDLFFDLQSKIKFFLKHLGLHEVMNYSMVSKEMIINNDLKPDDHLRLNNTISKEIEHMRTHLMPSLIKNIKDNEGKRKILRFFEVAKTYKKTAKDLPEEKYKLGIVANTDYFDLKGIVEALLNELNITDYELNKSQHPLFSDRLQLQYIINNKLLVEFGELKSAFKIKNQLKSNVYLAVFDFECLIENFRPLPTYKAINPFAVIKLDQTFENTTYEVVRKAAEKSKLLQKIEVVSVFKNKFTLRFYFSANDRNLTEEEAKKILTEIQNVLI